MLYEVMKSIKNFFPSKAGSKYGDYEIVNGSIDLPFVKQGQYFLVEGSDLNDGVYMYPATNLTDEDFKGYITPLSIPNDFLALVDEIEDWNIGNAPTAFASESFGGYSYSKATNASGNQVTWKDAFAGKLNPWRKI